MKWCHHVNSCWVVCGFGLISIYVWIFHFHTIFRRPFWSLVESEWIHIHAFMYFVSFEILIQQAHGLILNVSLNIIITCNSSDAGDGIFQLWGSIPCLLMPWILKTPGHQHTWYWLCRTYNRQGSTLRRARMPGAHRSCPRGQGT